MSGVGRPKVPLIEREAAIAKALEIIDRDGVEAFSIRNLGKELGVNGASLYHHFKDKEEILEGVRVLIVRDARVILKSSARATWQDYARTSCTRYRAALLAHPHVAPLMSPGLIRPSSQVVARDHLVEKMVEAGVPMDLVYPIMDSVEMLAFGSAVLNPHRLRPDERFPLKAEHHAPHLEQAIKATHRSADKLFKVELDALLEGWAAIIAREGKERR
jgi:AcrR family transcriptional regulator